jgi:hypothetical protein
MDKFWKAALSVGGVGTVGAFVLWSLYKDWLHLPLFSQMSANQTFALMLIFLALTFASLVSMLIVHMRTRASKADSHTERDLDSKVTLLEASLDPRSQRYEEDVTDGKRSIAPKTEE